MQTMNMSRTLHVVRGTEKPRSLFDGGLTRLKAALDLRIRFGEVWSQYAQSNPYELKLSPGFSDTSYYVEARLTEASPQELGVVFSEWLHHLRSSLDNGVYDLALALAWPEDAVGTNSRDKPPNFNLLHYPIAEEKGGQGGFDGLRVHRALPAEIMDKLEKFQPYKHPDHPHQSNLFWLNELARLDRHRVMHLCVGRLDLVDLEITNHHGFFLDQLSMTPEIETGHFTKVARIRSAVQLDSLAELTALPRLVPGIPEWKVDQEFWETSTKGDAFLRWNDDIFGQMARLEGSTINRFADLIELAGLDRSDQLATLYELGRYDEQTYFSEVVDGYVAKANGMHLSQVKKRRHLSDANQPLRISRIAA